VRGISGSSILTSFSACDAACAAIRRTVAIDGRHLIAFDEGPEVCPAAVISANACFFPLFGRGARLGFPGAGRRAVEPRFSRSVCPCACETAAVLQFRHYVVEESA